MANKFYLIGVLGGMGPAATVDFVNKVIALTGAASDQDHLPVLIASIPDVPDRTAALLHQGRSPVETLIRYRTLLENAGAQCIVMPCNTAHFWFDEVKKGSQAEMLSIVDAVVGEVKAANYQRVGVMATDGTMAAGFYQRQLERHRIDYVLPDEVQQKEIMRSIYLFKAGEPEEAMALMEKQYQQLAAKNVDGVILGCTEIPIILAAAIRENPKHFIDSNAALARATIAWYEEKMGRSYLSD
jgi:aspartate racemase